MRDFRRGTSHRRVASSTPPKRGSKLPPLHRTVKNTGANGSARPVSRTVKKAPEKPQKRIPRRPVTKPPSGGGSDGHRPSSGGLSRYLFVRLRWIVILVLFIPVISFVVTLDSQIRAEFSGQRWALPARVFARPLEVYPGMDLRAEDFAKELDALNYRKNQRLAEPGDYHRKGNTFYVYTRPFAFWDQKQTAQRLRFRFAKEQGLQQIADLDEQQQIALLRIEPVLIGKIYPTHKEDRDLVKLKEVPPLLIDALLAMEDRSFYEHSGISLRGLARAMVANIKAGGWVQGGSTLTQQLIKNHYLTSDRTLTRKVKEAVMAISLEWHYSKEEILEAYLNEVYLGQNGETAIHGMGTGSVFYFNRPLSQLELPELALLVALVRGASHYNPRKHPERVLKRRNLVLTLMAQQGRISLEAAERAKLAGMNLTKKVQRSRSAYPAFLDLVRRQLKRDYREEDLRSEGLQIFTTLDPIRQTQAENAVKERLLSLEENNKKIKNKLEAAMVVTDTQSGEVLALVGGRNPRYSGFNRALDTLRPIGSLVKPAVYLAALEKYKNYSLVSKLEDKDFYWEDEKTGEVWQPRNYDGKEHGRVPLFKALGASYNLATVDLGFNHLGLDKVRYTLLRLGVERQFPVYPSMLLGGISLTPLEVAQMYQTLASGGFRVPLRTIRDVMTHDSQPLRRYDLSVEQRFDPASVFVLNYALQYVVSSGTGQHIANDMLKDVGQLAGKTGTTNSYRDSWFAGFGRDVLAVSWLGNDDNKPINLSGSSGAMRVWADFMQRTQPRPLENELPPRVQWRWINEKTGRVGKRRQRNVIRMPFITG